VSYRLLVALALLLAACDPAPPRTPATEATNSARLHFEPASTTVRVGERFELLLRVQGGTASPRALDVSIRTNPALLQIRRALPHPDFDDDGALFLSGELDAQRGALGHVAELRTEPTRKGDDVALLRIELEAVAEGSSVVSLGAAALADGTGTPFALELSDASVTVVP
jgi:hypothetical protein